MKIKLRTPSEREAYVDGWNMCFKAFKGYLKRDMSKEDAIDIMEEFRASINSVVKVEPDARDQE